MPTPSTQAEPNRSDRKSHGPQIQAFYTRSVDKGSPVKLFVNQVKTSGHPNFDGLIGGVRVVLWIREKEGKKFLSIYGSVKDESGMLPPLGTAKVVVTDRGIAKLAIRMYIDRGKDKEVIWATASQKVSNSVLVAAGLDLKVLAIRKKAAVEARARKTETNTA